MKTSNRVNQVFIRKLTKNCLEVGIVGDIPPIMIEMMINKKSKGYFA